MSVYEKLKRLAADTDSLPYPIHEYAFMKTEEIPFSPQVREACEANMCGRYGKTWMCPPGVGDWRELKELYSGYQNAFVYTTKHDLEDSFDWEGMQEGGRQHALVDDALLEELKQEPEPYDLSGAGSCSLCEKCTYPDAPCRHPDKARRSLEACGIDVVALSKAAGLHYINGENTVTYFSILYY